MMWLQWFGDVTERVTGTGMNRADRTRWKSARTMEDLGELVIAWLNREITQTPYHCGPPARETYPLIPALTALNRSGFITDNSQLAESMHGRTWNTWVAGFVSDGTLARIRSAAEGTGLTVAACRDRDHQCSEMYAGCPWRSSGDFWADRCPAAADRIRDCWYVLVEDPEPGRNDLLWPVLTAALNRNEASTP